MVTLHKGFPGGLNGKETACHAGDMGSILGLGRCPGEGNGNPLQYSCPENPVDIGVWRAPVHSLSKSQTTEQLTHTDTQPYINTRGQKGGEERKSRR